MLTRCLSLVRQVKSKKWMWQTRQQFDPLWSPCPIRNASVERGHSATQFNDLDSRESSPDLYELMEIDAEERERLAPIGLRYQTPEPVVVERHLAIRFTMKETDTVRRTMME